jgi:hypothetical protein
MKTIVLFGLLASTAAHAEPRFDEVEDFDPPATPSAPAPQRELPRGDHKDPWTAVELSAGVTLGGVATAALVAPIAWSEGAPASVVGGLVAVGVTGFLAGPTIGHLYAGDGWNVWTTVRASAFAAPLVGLAADAMLGNHGGRDFAPAAGIAIGVVGGALLYTVGMIGETASAPFAANDYTASHVTLSIAPIQTRTGMTTGLGLAGTF